MKFMCASSYRINVVVLARPRLLDDFESLLHLSDTDAPASRAISPDFDLERDLDRDLTIGVVVVAAWASSSTTSVIKDRLRGSPPLSYALAITTVSSV
mmetsp:Transcript_13810/g.26818  ORF Transcript_13810/g.26818 Transcript_13810/m.26818 type:complete len:98 (+) Transcript_13810:1304-1597(+)